MSAATEAAALIEALIAAPESAVIIPPALRGPVLDVLKILARGEIPMYIPRADAITTQQAADLLNVSRPTLVKMLEDGKIPYQQVGTHRRLRLADVVAYREERSARQKAALRELIQLGEEMGLPNY